MQRRFVAALFTTFITGSLFAVSDTAVAQSNSWNLSRDIMTNMAQNPTMAIPPSTAHWTFMENIGNPNPLLPSAYTQLPNFVPNCGGSTATPPTELCWQALGGFPEVVASPTDTVNFNNGTSNLDLIQGMLLIHPSPTSQAVVRWRSPIPLSGGTATVTILGRITDLDPACGDGIQWQIKKSSPSSPPLTAIGPFWSGIPNGGGGTTFAYQNVVVELGTEIFFVVDSKTPNAGPPVAGAQPSDHNCDSTSLDVLIAQRP